jgi:hypothetical protein
MGQRQPDEQIEHDLVIQAAIDQFAASAKYTVLGNPGNERNAGVGHQYPDIVVTEKGTNRVKFILEVETSNSLDSSEVTQWRTYAGLGPPLYIIAPHLALPAVERMCASAAIKCHYGYYHKDEMGRFKVVLKRDTPAGSR